MNIVRAENLVYNVNVSKSANIGVPHETRYFLLLRIRKFRKLSSCLELRPLVRLHVGGRLFPVLYLYAITIALNHSNS